MRGAAQRGIFTARARRDSTPVPIRGRPTMFHPSLTGMATATSMRRLRALTTLAVDCQRKLDDEHLHFSVRCRTSEDAELQPPNTNSGCPANCRQITWLAGSDIWNSGSLPDYTGSACSVTCDGSTDNTSTIQACINAASTNCRCATDWNLLRQRNASAQKQCGAARRKSRRFAPLPPNADAAATTIKLGSSGFVTTQNFSNSSNLDPGTSYSVLQSTYTLTGTPQKGDTQLTIGSGTVSVGTYMVALERQSCSDRRHGQDGLCQWCAANTGYYTLYQIVKVVSFASGSGGAGLSPISLRLFTTLPTRPHGRSTAKRNLPGQSTQSSPFPHNMRDSRICALMAPRMTSEALQSSSFRAACSAG